MILCVSVCGRSDRIQKTGSTPGWINKSADSKYAADRVVWLTRLEKGRGNPGAGSNPAVCRKAALCFLF